MNCRLHPFFILYTFIQPITAIQPTTGTNVVGVTERLTPSRPLSNQHEFFKNLTF